MTEQPGLAGAGLDQPVPSPSGPSETPNPHGNLPGQYHTMHELWDLANALSYQVGELQLSVICAHGKQWNGHFDEATQTWVPTSSAEVQTWLDNYYAAYSNFGIVLDRANAAMKTMTAGAFWDVIPATDSEGNVFDALVAAFEPFDDLDRRLRQPGLGFPRECLPSYPNVPQPTAPDFSLDAYKVASAIIKPIQEAGNWMQSPGFMFATGAIIVVAGAVVVTQLVSVLPKRSK